MNHRLVAPAIVAMLASPGAADPTPANTSLLQFDGTSAIPPDVRARVKSAVLIHHEVSYRPAIDRKTAQPLSWRLAFATAEDPTTHLHYLRDITVVLVENRELQCTATTSDLVVDADKVGMPGDKPRAAMMVTVTVACDGSGNYHLRCGGGVIADGSAPEGCNPLNKTNIKGRP
jgi:hypothetical protein